MEGYLNHNRYDEQNSMAIQHNISGAIRHDSIWND